MRFFPLLALVWAGSAWAEGAASPRDPVPSPEFQWQIVKLFSSERCDLIRAATPATYYEKLKPNVRAIVAFCEPRDADHEALFASAERDDPTGDLIMVLHAKYVWKRDRERARPLWDKVLKHARNPSLRSMAERYLADQVEKDEILHLSAWSYQAKAAIGGGYESNPRLPLAPEPATRSPQAFSRVALGGGAQKWQSFGSLSFDYEGSYLRRFTNTELSFLANQLSVPVSLRLGAYEDIVFRPFYGISLAGSRTFATRYGIAVMGVAYRPEYKQSVQGAVFSERLLFPLQKLEEGTHYRFDYDWEFFRDPWMYRLTGLMEHVRATNDFHNGTDLKLSHTDVGAGFRVRHLRRGVSYETEVRALMRLDSLSSVYTNSVSGLRERKRRNDFTLAARPAVSFPVLRDVSLTAAYEVARTFSPVGARGDFADYNVFEQKGELLLMTEFSNY